MNWFPCPAICRWRKCAPFAVAPNHASLSLTPCGRYASEPYRQHSRHPVRGAGGRLVPRFRDPQLVTDALAHYRLVAGRGNIRGSEGPRNAVASGLLLAWQKEAHMESSVVAPPSSLPSLTNAANSGAMSCWALKRKAFLLFCSRRPAAILSITPAGGAAFAAAGRHRLRPGTAHRALQKFTRINSAVFADVSPEQAGPAKHWQQCGSSRQGSHFDRHA